MKNRPLRRFLFLLSALFSPVFVYFRRTILDTVVLVIADNYIAEFKALYKKRYGVELSDAEASFRANNLLNLYRAVLSPKPKGAVNEENGARHNTPYDEN